MTVSSLSLVHLTDFVESNLVATGRACVSHSQMVLMFKNVSNSFSFLKEEKCYNVIVNLEIILSQQAAKTKNIKPQEKGRQ